MLFVAVLALLGACASVPTGTSGSSAKAEESDSPTLRDKLVERFKTQIRSSVSPFALILSALEPKATASSSKDEDANVRILKSIEAGTGLMTFSDCKVSTTRTGSNIVTRSTCTVSKQAACQKLSTKATEFAQSISIDRLNKASCDNVAMNPVATKQNLY